MQISRTPPYVSLPAAYEPARERIASTLPAPLSLPSDTVSQQATRAIEEIHSAEGLLDRRRAQLSYGEMASGGRRQRAAAAYQELQRSDERSYVSQVLGIDVYA